MFESKYQPRLSRLRFAKRLLGWLGITCMLLCISLYIGMAGYHYLEQMPWIDALLNAAMILGGMGPVDRLATDAGKMFAACYAIYCGMLLVVCGGLLLAPVFHRILHHFHAEDSE